MKTISMFLAVVALGGCGDNIKPNNTVIDSGPGGDAGSGSGGFPAAPTLGPQIDRMGRPAINTALNHGFDPTVAAGSAKDAYNMDDSPGTSGANWLVYAPEFAKNLAIVDSIDSGLPEGSGASATTGGCGNQVLYNNNVGGGGSATATSYGELAGILSDDELFLDTSLTLCELPNYGQNYLAVEFAVVTGIQNSSCGGRMPTNDVMSTSLTALAIGIGGFDVTNDFQPAFTDGAMPHTDLTGAFPFLGPPH